MAQDEETQETSGTSKSVGAGLGIGILLLPFVFAWFTLRKGYSNFARVLSLGWLMLLIILLVVLGSPADNLDTTAGIDSEMSMSATDQDEADAAPPVEEPAPEAPAETPAFFTGEADEVGDQIAVVTDPQREALFSNGDATTWNCSGLVNNQILINAFVAVAELSEDNGLKVPMTSTCYLKRSNEEMFGRQITWYTMEFFVSETDMQNAKNPDRVLYNYRSAQFFPKKNGDLRLTLFVTDPQAQNAKLRCISLRGDIIGEDTCVKF